MWAAAYLLGHYLRSGKLISDCMGWCRWSCRPSLGGHSRRRWKLDCRRDRRLDWSRSVSRASSSLRERRRYRHLCSCIDVKLRFGKWPDSILDGEFRCRSVRRLAHIDRTAVPLPPSTTRFSLSTRPSGVSGISMPAT